MSRKKKHQLDWMSKLIKPVLKASTHVFTVAGVLVASAPLHRGLTNVVHGDVQGGTSHIVYDTTGIDTVGTGSLNTAGIVGSVAKTALVVGLGIGLVAGGAVLRKRIGRSK